MAEWYEEYPESKEEEKPWYEQYPKSDIVKKEETLKFFEEQENRLRKEARTFWQTISNSLVGEEAEWGEYWARGFGKSNTSLAFQYHWDTNIPGAYNFDEAFSEEPEDTGILERLLESGATLIGDFPTFAPGIAAGLFAGPAAPFVTGLVGGTINESMKQTYLKALQRGDVDTFSEFAEIFVNEGLKHGWKSGLSLGTALQLGGTAGIFLKNPFTEKIASTAIQVGSLNLMNSYLSDQLPTKESLINDTLLFGIFNFAGGSKSVDVATKYSLNKGRTGVEIIKDFVKDPTKIADSISINVPEIRIGEKVIIKERKSAKRKQEEEAREAREKLDETLDPVSKSEKEIMDSIKDGDIPSGQKLSAKELVTYVFDKAYPVKRIVQAFNQLKKGIDQALDPYQMIRMTENAVSKAYDFFSNGPYKIKTYEPTGTRPLNEIVKDFSISGELKRFQAYLVSKRIIELETKRYISTGYNLKAAKEVVARGKGKYEKTAAELKKYQADLLKYLEDGGVISSKMRTLMEEANANYVPFHRMLEDRASDIVGKTANVRSPFKRIKGSKEKLDIQNPIEVIYKNTLYHVQLAERNFALTQFFDMIKSDLNLARELGITKAKKQIKPIEIKVEELADAFGVTRAEIKSQNIDNFLVFRQQSFALKDNQIMYFKNGKPEVWDLPTAELANALKSANPLQQFMTRGIVGKITEVTKAPTKLLRSGVTLDPTFLIRNIMRDGILSGIVSRHQAAIPMQRTFLGLSAIFNKTKEYQQYMQSGSWSSTFVRFDKYMEAGVKDAMQSQKIYNEASANPIKRAVELLRTLSDISEQAAKVGEFILTKRYMEGKAKGLTNRQILDRAGFEARDIFDFAKQGILTEVYGNFTAFTASRLRGLDKLYEAFTERPGSTFIKSIQSITAPSVALWFVNNDDPAYQALPDYRKDLFWNIPIHKLGLADEPVFITIPKPWEMGLLFGSSVERLLDALYVNDKSGYEDMLVNLGVQFKMSGYLNLPDLVRPFIELENNRSIFFDRPIIPARYKNPLLPEQEYDRKTSAFAKGLANLNAEIYLNKVPFIGGLLESPMKIDHLINSYTGGLGKEVVKIMDIFSEITGITKRESQKPFSYNWIKNLDRLPFVKAFVIRQPGMSSSHLTKYYRRLNELRFLDNFAKRLEDEERVEELETLLNSKEYLLYQDLKAFSKDFRDEYEYMNMIYQYQPIEINDNFKTKVLEAAKKLGDNYKAKTIAEGLKEQFPNSSLTLLTNIVNDIVEGRGFVEEFLPNRNEKIELLDQNYQRLIDLAKEANDLYDSTNIDPTFKKYKDMIK